MPTHVDDAVVYRADPAAPKKRWTGGPLAEADQVAVLDDQPKVSQPFRFAGGSTINDFVPGSIYWLLGTASDGKRVWMLTLKEVRPAGRDVMLVCNSS
jgi:hypothetical protein